MIIHGITLIILGLVAVPSLVLDKKPNAKEIFDKIAPYQGWAGVVFCIWGIWGLISAILNISILSTWPVSWVLWVLCSLIEASLGFILGYSLIYKYVLSKNETSAKKGEQVLAKLLPMQGKIGIAAIIIGIVYIIVSIMKI